MGFVLTLMLLATSPARAGDAEAQGGACTPSSAADLKDPLLDGEEGVIQLEEEAVGAARSQVDARLRCLVEILAPTDVAAVHRLHAYAAFVAGDTSAARRAFGAARAADPGWTITDHLAPPGTPLRELFNTASLDVATETVKLPSGTVLYVDGARTSDRPLDRPALLQLVSADSSGRKVLDSIWLTEDEPLPDWSSFAAGAAPVAAVKSPRVPAAPVARPEDRSSLAWWVGAGVAVVAGAGVYGWALGDHAHYVDTSTGMTEAELDALQKGANTKVAVSSGLGAVGVGLAVVALRW